MKFINIAIFFLLLLSKILYSQTPSWIWEKSNLFQGTFDGLCGEDRPSSAIDSNGNIYLIGDFWDSLKFDNCTVKGGSFFISKFNSSGNCIWIKSANNSSTNAFALTTDKLNNIYIVGTSYSNSPAIFDNDTINKTNSFLLKLDTSGNLIWCKNIIDTNMCQGPGMYSIPPHYYISTDNNCNVFLTGYFCTHTITFGNITLNNPVATNYTDIFLVKYSSSGHVLWAKTSSSHTATNGSYGLGIKNDHFGNIYIIGKSKPGTFYFGSDTLNLSNVPFIAKFDPNGNNIWMKSFQGYYSITDLTVDHSNQPSFTGYYSYNPGTTSYDTIPSSFGNFILNNYNGGILIVKLDSLGSTLWAKSSGDTNYTIQSYQVRPPLISSDKNDNIYVSGNYQGKISFSGDSAQIINGAGFFLVKYNSTGNEQWLKSVYGDSLCTCCQTNVIDSAGNVVLSGTFNSDSLYFGNQTLFNNFNYPIQKNNIFIAKLGSSAITGIKIQKENETIIYPNPTKSTFKIKLPYKTLTVKICNSIGQVIEKRTIHDQSEQNFSINENGVYIVQVYTDKAIITRKVVISK